MTDFKELKDEALAGVVGGMGSLFFDQAGDFDIRQWYSNDNFPNYIFRVATILVDPETSTYSVHFIRYWYDKTTGKAWNFGTTTISSSDAHLYKVTAAPNEVDDTFTPIIPF